MDWGGLGGIESLDPSLPQLTPVYSSLTEGLKKVGYKERVDLFGAPYDFRLAADGLEQVRDFPYFLKRGCISLAVNFLMDMCITGAFREVAM